MRGSALSPVALCACAAWALAAGACVKCKSDEECALGFSCVAGSCAGAGAPADAGVVVDAGPPPASCRAARAAGATVSGVVTLDDGDGPYQAWCEQSLAGGGWALALKIDGNAATFLSGGPAWTDSSLINEGSLDPAADDEAKLAPFVRTRTGAVLLALAPTGVVPLNSVALDVHGPPLQSLFASGDLYPSHAADSAWLNALPGAVLQASCRRQGINVRRDRGNLVRIGLVGNNELDCRTPDSSIGVGDGDPCNPNVSVQAGNIQNDPTLGLQCAPARAWVYVRDDDATFHGSASTCDAQALVGDGDGIYLVDGQPRRCDLFTQGGGWTGVFTFDAARDPCPGTLVLAPGPDHVACRLAGSDVEAPIFQGPAPFPYKEILVSALAYQVGTPDAFGDATGNRALATIEGGYVDGISVTRGTAGTRAHVATFAMGGSDGGGAGACPCASGAVQQAFVDNYRCEAGSFDGANPFAALADPAWDGKDGPTGACASEASGEPVLATVPADTLDALEVRVLRDNDDVENFDLYRLELYVR